MKTLNHELLGHTGIYKKVRIEIHESQKKYTAALIEKFYTNYHPSESSPDFFLFQELHRVLSEYNPDNEPVELEQDHENRLVYYASIPIARE